jgi:hypothetical protein
MKHFEKEQKINSNKHIDRDTPGPWKGMEPKDDYGNFMIVFKPDGSFEFTMNQKRISENIDHGERSYDQKSEFKGTYEVLDAELGDLLTLNLKILHEVRAIIKCTNFEFNPLEEKTHNLLVKFKKTENNDFIFSESDIFKFMNGFYGGFIFSEPFNK